jgi:stage III sporulation protein AG
MMKNWRELLKKTNWTKLKKSDWIVLALVGVLLLILAMPAGEKSDTTEVGEQSASAQMPEEISENQEDSSQQDYALELEERVEAVLTQMDGVGKVEVMITLADEGEHLIEKDLTVEGERSQENTVYVETKDATYPYIQKEKLPEIEGIMVVAEGGGNPVLVSEISEALQALFPVEVHRIKVVKMCSKEDSK